MKALLLAGGRGERMGEFTDTRNKCVLPVVDDKVLLDYPLAHVKKMVPYITELVIVIGYRARDIIDRIELWYNESDVSDELIGFDISFIHQPLDSIGMVNALSLARERIFDEDDFMLVLGDEYIGDDFATWRMHHKFKSAHCDGVIGYVTDDNPRSIERTFSISVEGNDMGFHEKMVVNGSRYKGTGMGMFHGSFLSAIELCEDYPDAIESYIEAENYVELCELKKPYYNINTVDDYVELGVYLTGRSPI